MWLEKIFQPSRPKKLDPNFEQAIANEDPDLQDFARTIFYPDYNSDGDCSHLPSAEIRRILAVVREHLEK